MVVLPVGNPRRLRRFERGSHSLPARLVCLGLVLQWVTGSWPVQAEQIEQAAAPHGGSWERIGGGRGRASDGLGVPEASAAVSGVGQGDLSSVGLGGGERPRRVAFGARGQLAWSDGTGVVLRRQGAVDRVALAGTTALVFDARGALWIASLQGLHVWPERGRPIQRRLPGGERANRVLGLAYREGVMVVATGAGAFWSPAPDAERDPVRRVFQSLDPGAVAMPVIAAALRFAPTLSKAQEKEGAHSAWAEVWLLTATGLERVVGLQRATGLRVLSRDRWGLPRPRASSGPLDLSVERRGTPTRLMVVYPDVLVHRELGAPGAPEREAGGWRTERPVLAPGVSIRRARLDSLGAVVVAGSRGLFEANTLGGPFARVPGEAGFQACEDLAPGPDDVLFAICRSGLFRRRLPSLPPQGSPQDESLSGPAIAVPPGSGSLPESAAPPLSGSLPESTARPRSGSLPESAALPRPGLAVDPPLGEIRRRALERAGLMPGRVERLWRGLERRGYWPDLSLRLGADFDRDERRFADQSFVSGGMRDLLDRTRDRSEGFEALLALEWTLGDVAYPDQAVDLSREQRQIVSLRDDITDELHQLYFERARLRARLSDPGPLPPEEERALRERAAELLAGLDAWTGGWVGLWQAAAASQPSMPRSLNGPDSPQERYAP